MAAEVYLDAYLQDEVKNKRLRIIPVCTASEVKNTYNRLQVLFEELRQSNLLKGKVFLLTDTDSSPVEFNTVDGLESHLMCRRIVNTDEDTILVKIQASPKAPNTDIEDALNGKIFNKVLYKLTNPKENETYSFIKDQDKDQVASAVAMDLRDSEKRKIEEFFNQNKGEYKVLFAQEYVKEMCNSEYKIPDWIQEIKCYFAG